MTKGRAEERGRSTRRSFADIVREVASSPAHEPAERRPGLWGSAFVDKAGREYELVEPAVTPERALEAARAAALVVWDSCGCGGGCGWDWCSDRDVAEMVRSGPPVIGTSTSSSAAVTEFHAADGAVLLVVTGAVSWSDRLA